jgi:AcrR family transcriptional regulator
MTQTAPEVSPPAATGNPMADLLASTTPRDRLIVALAGSIRERGFGETTIADIVRLARTSRRTFYAEFDNKEACYVALLAATNQFLTFQIAAAVDPLAPWSTQVRQAIEAYVETLASEPEITLSWIRELPALGALGRQVQREAMSATTDMLLALMDNPEFRRAGLAPLSRPLAILLVGGLRELSANIVEAGGDLRGVSDVGIEAAMSLIAGPSRTTQ